MKFSDFRYPIEQQEAGRWLDVKMPDGTPTDFRILIPGPYSDRQRYARVNTQVGFIDRVGVDGRMSPEMQDEMALSFLSRIVLDWQGLTDNDEPMPCNVFTAEKVFRAVPYIREQVDAFAASLKPYKDDPAPADPAPQTHAEQAQAGGY